MRLRQKNIERGTVLFFVTMIFVMSFTVRCARPSAPIGGPKDTIPPVLKKVAPLDYATNFKKQNIVFTFNEFMQLKDVQKEVVVSPPMNVKPQVSLKGKSVVTKFPDDLVLDSNTTYRIDYGRALADNNEGNPANQISFVFSTGNHIDSLSMSGLVVDARTGDTIPNALVFMYDDFPDTLSVDSTLFKGKIRAQFRTDSTGVYFGANLKPKNYRVYVVADVDKNGIYTVGTDKVGFYDTALNPAELDPFKVWFDPISRLVYAAPQVTFRVFEESRFMNQALREIKRPAKYKITTSFNAFNAKIDSIKIKGIPDDHLLREYTKHRDTVHFWIKRNRMVMPDTLKGTLWYWGIDSVGQPASLSKDFSLSFFDKDAPVLTKKEKDALSGKTKISFWQRIKRWFQFRKRKQEKKQLAYITSHADSTAIRLDALRIDSLRRDSLRIDSIRISKLMGIIPDSIRTLKVYIDPSGEYNPNYPIILRTDLPIDTFKMDSVVVEKITARKRSEEYFDEKKAARGINAEFDRVREKVTFQRDTLDIRKFHIRANWQPDSEYAFYIPPVSIIDIEGNKNDTIRHTIKTSQSRKLTTLDIAVSNTENECYLMELVDEKGKVILSKTVSKDSTYRMGLLPVLKYRLRMVRDRNCNGVFDLGNLVKRIQPEQIAFYVGENGRSIIETKENFEFTIPVDIGTLFKKDVATKRDEENN